MHLLEILKPPVDQYNDHVSSIRDLGQSFFNGDYIQCIIEQIENQRNTSTSTRTTIIPYDIE
jgi:hypothetical protein